MPRNRESVAPYLNLTETISYDLEPPGVVTSTLSPLVFPMSARASGDVIERRLERISASSVPTIW